MSAAAFDTPATTEPMRGANAIAIELRNVFKTKKFATRSVVAGAAKNMLRDRTLPLIEPKMDAAHSLTNKRQKARWPHGGPLSSARPYETFMNGQNFEPSKATA